MKNLKRIMAVALALVFVVTVFAGCHKKNETAVKIGDYKFTSGYYSCALVFADIEGRNEVTKQFEKDGKDTTDIDYLKQKIDGKSYEKWVKNKAIEILKENAGYKALCKEKGFKMTADNKSTSESYANSNWDYMGYADLFTANGVSKETYLKFTLDSYYSQIYFDGIYGKDGTNPISEEELKTTLKDKFCLIDRISVDTTDLEDEDIAAKKEQLNGYLEKLNSGASFADIFVEYDLAEGKEEARNVTPGDGKESPIDPNAEVVGDSESSMPCDYYDEITAMQIGENKIIEAENELVLVKRLDIMSDGYYLTQYDETLRSEVVGDKADEEARKKADELGVTQIKKAVNLFKVKNITYPEQES